MRGKLVLPELFCFTDDLERRGHKKLIRLEICQARLASLIHISSAMTANKPVIQKNSLSQLFHIQLFQMASPVATANKTNCTANDLRHEMGEFMQSMNGPHRQKGHT